MRRRAEGRGVWLALLVHALATGTAVGETTSLESGGRGEGLPTLTALVYNSAHAQQKPFKRRKRPPRASSRRRVSR